jgi:hypothetical protein
MISKTTNRIVCALIGFGVGWLASFVEYLFTATAWGGPFTILMIPFAAAFISASSVVVAVLVGLLLRLPRIRDVWRLTGYKVLFLSVIPVTVLVFSSPLGLRTIDPVSGYSLMSAWVSVPCYVLLVFPFVNLPTMQKQISTAPPHQT